MSIPMWSNPSALIPTLAQSVLPSAGQTRDIESYALTRLRDKRLVLVEMLCAKDAPCVPHPSRSSSGGTPDFEERGDPRGRLRPTPLHLSSSLPPHRRSDSDHFRHLRHPPCPVPPPLSPLRLAGRLGTPPFPCLPLRLLLGTALMVPSWGHHRDRPRRAAHFPPTP